MQVFGTAHADTLTVLTLMFRQVLCSPNVLRQVNGQDILMWGGNVWDAEPYNLSMQLKVSSFPFMALMLCESERSVQILDRVQGMFSLKLHCKLVIVVKGSLKNGFWWKDSIIVWSRREVTWPEQGKRKYEGGMGASDT